VGDARGTRAGLILLGFAAGTALAQPARAPALADLSLEELANVEVTSVSRRAERLAVAAASIYVIGAEDIRRSGARSLPEVLRLAPNLYVAQVSASGYAISARGFTASSANKLLVLIDGRSVYTPLFSGVFWDVQDVLLEDIDRIEVISGPGGTLWGVNAVNGVINVITRSAAGTHGAMATAGTGNGDSEGALRYGGKLGADGHYRVYAKAFERYATVLESGSTKDDAWHKKQTGFRADWSGTADRFSVNGNAYEGEEGQPRPGTIAVGGANPPLGSISVSGVNLTARWDRVLEAGSSLTVQGYFDRTERNVRPQFAETLDIYDLQLQHSLRPIGIHAPVWGAEYRHGRDRVTNTTFLAFAPPRPFFGFLPERVNQDWSSLFAQDEMTLRDDLLFTIGARLERNDYTGNEFLPSARLAWKVRPEHLLWTAASRAVRAPSRLDRDTFIPASPPFLLAGGPEVRSEVAKVYELGYRGQPARPLSISITAFRAEYEHLRSQEIAPSGTSVFFANGMEGKSSGIEAWGTLRASATWRLSAGVALIDMDLHPKPGSNDTNVAALANDPNRQFRLRSAHELPYRQELDINARHVAALPNPSVPSYTAVDARYAWRLHPELELSLTVQNLLDRRHVEFGPAATRTDIERGWFVRLKWTQR
jgi:iron complex outermembrane recepter protein